MAQGNACKGHAEIRDFKKTQSLICKTIRDIGAGRILANQLALPPLLANVHNVFHVSMLRKYVPKPQHIIDYQTLGVKEDVLYDELPTIILE